MGHLLPKLDWGEEGAGRHDLRARESLEGDMHCARHAAAMAAKSTYACGGLSMDTMSTGEVEVWWSSGSR